MEKRLKIVVGTNTLTTVKRACYSNHCQFWFRLGRNYPNIDFLLNHPERMSIDNMRTMTAKVAIAHDADYILFLDDDVMIPPNDTLQRLLDADADVVAGWTLIRGYPFPNMFFKFLPVPGTDKTSLRIYDDPEIDPNGLIHCDAVGFSLALLKVSALKTVEEPWFVTGPKNTEDVYYCMKLREVNPKASIMVHSFIETSHCLGDEYIDPRNKDLYKKYVEATDPTVVLQINKQIEEQEAALKV